MNPSQIYIAISVIVFAIVALFVFFVNKDKEDKKLTELTKFAFWIYVGRDSF